MRALGIVLVGGLVAVLIVVLTKMKNEGYF